MLHLGDLVVVAYEGWDEAGPRGIGLDIGRERWMEASTTHLVFEAAPGDTSVRVFTVGNAGIGNLTIDRIAVLGRGFEVHGPAAPACVKPDRFGIWEVRYMPDGPGNHSGAVLVYGDDPLIPSVSITLRGSTGNH